MGRQSDGESIDLDELRARLEQTDLIPSHRPLLDDIERRFALLDQAGVSSVAGLQRQLKTANSLEELAETSKVDADYLVLLKRTVRRFFPKPRALKDVHWLDQRVVPCLIDAGINNTDQFTKAATNGIYRLEQQLHLSGGSLSDTAALCDLSVVQWVSPNFAGALIAAGYRTAEALAAADAQTLQTVTANDGSTSYRGNVGLRDIRRVIQAAGYVHWPDRD